MNNAPIILLTGIPGTGKTTFSNKIINILGDRYSLLDTIELRREVEFFEKRLSILTDIVGKKIQQLSFNNGLIVEGVWKTPKRRKEICLHAVNNGRNILIIHMKAEVEDILQRVINRPNSNPWQADTNRLDVVSGYIESYKEPSIDEQDRDRSGFIIVDTSNNKHEVINMSQNLEDFFENKILPILLN